MTWNLQPFSVASWWFFSAFCKIQVRLDHLPKDRGKNSKNLNETTTTSWKTHVIFNRKNHTKRSRHLEGLEILEECEEAQGLGDAKNIPRKALETEGACFTYHGSKLTKRDDSTNASLDPPFGCQISATCNKRSVFGRCFWGGSNLGSDWKNSSQLASTWALNSHAPQYIQWLSDPWLGLCCHDADAKL